MTKNEFEERTGLTCLNSTFDFINRVYMAAGEQDKDTFCKEWKEMMYENKIIRELTETCESLKKNLDDALRMNKGMANQIEIREARIDQLQRLVNATLENVNLAVFDGLRGSFEANLGKVTTMKLRKEAGWTLTPEDIDWLIDHCEEE